MVLAWSRILRSSVNIFVAPSAEFLCHFFSPFRAPCLLRYYGQLWSDTFSRGDIQWDLLPAPLCNEVPSEDFCCQEQWMQDCSHSLKSTIVKAVCSVILSPLHESRSLVVHSWFSQEYKIWYIPHLEWAFSFKRKSKFLEIWDWHSIALNRSIFYS